MTRMGKRKSSDATTYRPSFIRVFFATFLLGAGAGALFAVLLRWQGVPTENVASYSFLHVLSIVYLWTMVATAVMVWSFSVTVSPSGIRGRTFWGTARTLEWHDIVGAARKSVLGIRFLRLYTTSKGAPMWLPVFLSGHAAFVEEVTGYLPADHPLALALQS